MKRIATQQIKGTAELDSFFDALPENMRRNVLRGAMRAGVKVIQEEAQLRVPVKSGKLKSAIKISTNVRNDMVTGKVKFRGEHSFLALFTEMGVAAHIISVEGLKGGASTVNRMVKAGSLHFGQNFFAETVDHPGVAAHPFLRPAFDAKKGEAVAAVQAYITARLKAGNIDRPLVEADDEE